MSLQNNMTENPEFLTDQLITYIGNKRSLLTFITEGIEFVQKKLNKSKLECLDIFSGSGVVSRLLKGYSSSLTVNDLEYYAKLISQCYLANKSELNIEKLKELYVQLLNNVQDKLSQYEDFSDGEGKFPGFISRLYAPVNENDVHLGERCFYTPYNAHYIDLMRQEIDLLIPEEYKPFFIAPLLGQCSVHANTAGIFKGFYKNSKTGIGQFGGNGKNALSRICSNIQLPFPVFSNNECDVKVFQQEANTLAASEELYANLKDGVFDLVYLDPPYNQHPYGSNYFMLNLVANYQPPEEEKISRVSGIPKTWNRSSYNKKKISCQTFESLIAALKAKFLLISFNNEGFISREEMEQMLSRYGNVSVLESKYNAFRGSRNLRGREIHVSEYIFILQKKEYI